MEKLVFLSVLFANIAIPAWSARRPDPKEALRRAVVGCAVANAAYVFVLIYVLPRIS